MAEEPGPSRRGDDASEDRGIPLPELPLMEEPLGSPNFRLRRGGEPRPGRPFVVSGRRLLVSGSEDRGVGRIRAHPFRICRGPRLDGYEAEHVVTTPIGVERRLRAGNRVVLERVVVPREAPVALLEWESRTGAAVLELAWACDLGVEAPADPASEAALRWRRAGRAVAVAGGGDARAVFLFSHRPDALEVAEDGDVIACRARFIVQARNSVRMAVVGGGGDALVGRAVRAADRTAAAVRSAAAHAERLLSEGLTLDAPDAVAVQTVEWAKVGLDARLAESPGVGRALLDGTGEGGGSVYRTRAAVLGALACLAAGEVVAAHDTLVFLGRHQSADGAVPAACSTAGAVTYDEGDDGASTLLYLLLAARYHAWTGDTATVQAEWPRLLRAYGHCATASAGAERAGLQAGLDRGLAGVVLRELGLAAEAMGDRGAAMEMRRLAGAAGSTGAGERGDVDPSPSVGTLLGVPPADRAPWTYLLRLVEETLGVEPDAGRGRVVLRTAPPADWSGFRVANLRLGDAVVGVRYRREGDTHSFRIRQDRGSTPVQVILEPALPGRALRSARVDGIAAELDARARDGHIVVPLQVVLDHERTVELDVEPAPAG